MKDFIYSDTLVTAYTVLFCNKEEAEQNIKNENKNVTFHSKEEAIGCAKGLLILNEDVFYCCIIENVIEIDVLKQDENLIDSNIIWEGYATDTVNPDDVKTEDSESSCYS